METIFTADAKMTPYWWEQSPPEPATEAALPAKVDALVVGSGYTGLHAAIELARGGRDVLVCDAEQIGFGCSTRNGGQVSTSVKPDFASLAKAHGEDVARRIFEDGRQSLQWTEAFIGAEGIDCAFKVVGRYHVAHDDKSFQALAASIRNRPKGLEVPAYVVPRAEQRSELGTDVYHGGVVIENHASLDPGRYHAGLVRIAHAGGAVADRLFGRDGARQRRGAKRRSRHQRLFRTALALASPPRHPDRQLHHRDGRTARSARR